MKFGRIFLLAILSSIITACSSDLPPAQPRLQEVVIINITSYYNSVWFDNNATQISSDFDAIISLNANYLLANPLAQIQIQGNASEVGSKEHNHKLATARTKAVAAKLIALGVNPKQIQQISFDTTRPVFPSDSRGHSPKNRRADIVYISGAPLTYYIDQLPILSTEDDTIEFDPINIKEQRQKYQPNTASNSSAPQNNDNATPLAIIPNDPGNSSSSAATPAAVPPPPISTTTSSTNAPTPESIGALSSD